MAERLCVRHYGKDGTIYYGRTMDEAIQECNDDEEGSE